MLGRNQRSRTQKNGYRRNGSVVPGECRKAMMVAAGRVFRFVLLKRPGTENFKSCCWTNVTITKASIYWQAFNIVLGGGENAVTVRILSGCSLHLRCTHHGISWDSPVVCKYVSQAVAGSKKCGDGRCVISGPIELQQLRNCRKEIRPSIDGERFLTPLKTHHQQIVTRADGKDVSFP